jgi:stage III sporulation protein AA
MTESTVDMIRRYLVPCLADSLSVSVNAVLAEAEEIRIRQGQPVCVVCGGAKYTVPYKPTVKDIADTVSRMSRYSVYAFNEELKCGYLTLEGGYRVGVCGTVVCDGNKVTTIKNISSLNIRVSREVKGCADKVIDKIYVNKSFQSTLIISPPACGKTTLLRDIIRLLSLKGLCVGVVDERSEIAGSFLGQAQIDLGINTDILDGCKKDVGMYMLLRSMSPEVIAVDEIGLPSELECIREIVNAGVGLLCSVHSTDMEELKKRTGFAAIIDNGLFKRYVVLSKRNGVGTVENIIEGG